MPINIQEAHRTSIRLYQERKILPPHNQNTKYPEERIIKVSRGKGQVTYKGRPIRIMCYFSTETLQARR